MHNIVHNMADDVCVSNHLNARNGVYQYVQRVPEDLRSAFPFPRIQRSLGTRDQRQARSAALDLDRLWDERFNDARLRSGIVVGDTGPAVVSVENWTWPDGDALAKWFGASLIEEDWRARLSQVRGSALGSEPDLAHLPWRPDDVVKEHIARQRRLEDMAVATYAAERLSFVQSYVRRIGIVLSRTEPLFERFMAACLQAELAYSHVFQLREARRGGLQHQHPDTIEGRWRAASPTASVAPLPVAAPTSSPLVPLRAGKTLVECRAKWIENRVKSKKQVRADYLRDMDQTIAAFEAQAGVSDIGEIRRRHILSYRDKLESKGDYKVATVNKKVGYISALMRTALKAGWTENALGENIFLEVPEDEGTRGAISRGGSFEHLLALDLHGRASLRARQSLRGAAILAASDRLPARHDLIRNPPDRPRHCGSSSGCA